MHTDIRTHDLAQRLLRYSAVAGLATAGALVVGPSAAVADGVVVWGDGPDTRSLADEPFGVDFDGGTAEFALAVRTGTFTATLAGYTYPVPYTAVTCSAVASSVSFLGLEVAAGFFSAIMPDALEPGDPIAPATEGWAHPDDRCLLVVSLPLGVQGQWAGLTDPHYLGVRYGTGQGVHYGWVELTVNTPPQGDTEFTVYRYGHNTTAGEATTAGETGPAAVELSAMKAGSGLRAAGAAAFAALAALATRLRARLTQQQTMIE